MSSLWRFFRFILFRLSPEVAHEWTFRLLRLGRPVIQILSPAPEIIKEPSVFPKFTLPVGLAAGFDKDSTLLHVLPSLGFGFAEIGTVTLRPQAGNAPPRLFRDAGRSALRNRMGFNSQGAQVVSQRLDWARQRIPHGFGVGVNIGKNKSTSENEAWKDYAQATAYFSGLADYLVINVSSPNTPGLRGLQSQEGLRPILSAVLDEVSGWSKSVPVLLKFAPDLSREALLALVSACEEWGAGGFVLTNTLPASLPLEGGWSGTPLRDISAEALSTVRAVTTLPLISVGGIGTVEEAQRRWKLGADLIQIYTAWVYQGPSFPFLLSADINAPQK